MIVNWYLTNQCNLKCVYCYASAFTGTDEEILNENETLSIAHQIAEISKQYPLYLSILGGEPFMHSNLVKALSIISRSCEIDEIFTNGTFLEPRIAERLIDLRIKKINVSLDSFNNDINHKTRKGFTSKQLSNIIKTIEAIQRIKETEEIKYPEIVITPVLTRKNCDDLLNMVNVCYHHNIGIDIQTLYPYSGRAKICSNELFLSAPEEIDTLIAFAKEVRQYPLPVAQVSDQSPLVLAYINKVCGKNVLPIWDSRCQLFKTFPYISIKWNGDVLACMYDTRRYRCPSLRRSKLSDILEFGIDFFLNYVDSMKRELENNLWNICWDCHFFKSGWCTPCPLPDSIKGDMCHLRCFEVLRRDKSIYEAKL